MNSSQLFRHVKACQTETWISRRKVSDIKLYIAAARSPKSGELLIAAGLEKPDNMITDYIRRRAIEVLPGNLKKRGFDVEATHMTAPEKMNRLMGMLSLTVLWCMTAGHWEYGDIEMLPLNNHYRP